MLLYFLVIGVKETKRVIYIREYGHINQSLIIEFFKCPYHLVLKA